MARTILVLGGWLLWAVAISSASAGARSQPLVDDGWLVENLGSPGLVVLDLQPAQAYQRAHIPGAVNTDYGKWRVSVKGAVPKILPSVSQLEALIGGLGIDNDSHVVLVPFGQSAGDLASATRIYWTFKAMGHDRVSILNGGLIAYAKGGKNRPLARGANTPTPNTFKARPQPSYFPSKTDVAKALAEGTTLVDNRSRAEYLGIYGSGVKGRAGTIPGALNLPYDWLTVNGGGRLHALEDLQSIFRSSGVPVEGELISFCHTGHRTSLAWFVSHELFGNDQARLYDGSIAEWAVDSGLPLQPEVDLECRAC
jgi:thiosulfate/3-mercaptopyruvate sulfurtransferase